MTVSPSAVTKDLLAEYEGPWHDNTPVFACCRRSVAIALERVDVADVATMDVTSRVLALRAAVEDELPDHLATHRCCAGHLADLAFDLPDLLAPAQA